MHIRRILVYIWFHFIFSCVFRFHKKKNRKMNRIYICFIRLPIRFPIPFLQQYLPINTLRQIGKKNNIYLSMKCRKQRRKKKPSSLSKYNQIDLFAILLYVNMHVIVLCVDGRHVIFCVCL